MRSRLLSLALLIAAAGFPANAAPLIGGPKTISLDADGNIPGVVVSTQMGMGYVKGAKQVAVPLVAVAFETAAMAKTTHGSGGKITTKSLEMHLLIDEKVLQAIADQLQTMVEKDLAAQGFEILPKESVDHEARWTGIAKNDPIGTEVGDNFMSGFGGNGTKNRWFTAGNRPLFGTGAQAALSETSPLIRTAREKKFTLLFYRFKVQFTSIDAKNNLLFSSVKGENGLHMLNADLAVFTPENTQGGIFKLKANVTAGADFVKELRELPRGGAEVAGVQMSAALQSLLSGAATTATSSKNSGHYAVLADPELYKSGSLALIHAASRQFAQALRKAQ